MKKLIPFLFIFLLIIKTQPLATIILQSEDICCEQKRTYYSDQCGWAKIDFKQVCFSTIEIYVNDKIKYLSYGTFSPYYTDFILLDNNNWNCLVDLQQVIMLLQEITKQK